MATVRPWTCRRMEMARTPEGHPRATSGTCSLMTAQTSTAPRRSSSVAIACRAASTKHLTAPAQTASPYSSPSKFLVFEPFNPTCLNFTMASNKSEGTCGCTCVFCNWINRAFCCSMIDRLRLYLPAHASNFSRMTHCTHVDKGESIAPYQSSRRTDPLVDPKPER